jgi:hypothetical protein
VPDSQSSVAITDIEAPDYQYVRTAPVADIPAVIDNVRKFRRVSLTVRLRSHDQDNGDDIMMMLWLAARKMLKDNGELRLLLSMSGGLTATFDEQTADGKTITVTFAFDGILDHDAQWHDDFLATCQRLVHQTLQSMQH